MRRIDRVARVSDGNEGMNLRGGKLDCSKDCGGNGGEKDMLLVKE